MKFIDLSTQMYNTHCELCLVDADKYIKQMKLERILDQYDKVRTALVQNLQRLKDVDKKIEDLSKGVNVTNALTSTIMAKIDDMEKQTYREIDFVFKRLRDRFTKFNPFKDSKFFIRDKLEQNAQ
jgi:hypothetical protein